VYPAPVVAGGWVMERQQQLFVARLVLGLVQGLGLCLLFTAYDQLTWPATEPLWFAPLTVVALLVPLLVSQALGNMRSATLLVWALVAAVILAGLSWYDVWHLGPGELPRGFFPAGVVPTAHTLFICGLFLFTAHALVTSGDSDRRIVAHYPTLFDQAWKLGTQAGIIVAFTAAFWIILLLGAAMFDMIKLQGFGRFLGHSWAWIPLTTMAAGAAIHITDTRASLVHGVRTLALTLLGWLLPVIALLAFAFLICLVFTGLQPLWETRFATLLLLAAAAVLITHINAAYQDGDPAHQPPHIVRVTGTLAAVLLAFIVWIAAYALWLRVGQYGWSIDRLYSAAAVLVAAMFAVGYLVAALLPGPWLKLIERWNVLTAFLFLAVLLALSTPLADPMRLAVMDQTHRLHSGAVKPADFDFDYLAHAGGRYGKEALNLLKKSRDPDISEAASVALVAPEVLAARDAEQLPPPVVRKKLVGTVPVYPKGKSLPDTFRAFVKDEEKRNSFCTSARLPDGGMRCYPFLEDFAVIRDFDGDGIDDILMVYRTEAEKRSWSAKLFKHEGNTWRPLGSAGGTDCQKDREALQNGNFKALVPLQRDLEIDGRRFRMVPYEEDDGCH
jgi:hypothetical protein